MKFAIIKYITHYTTNIQQNILTLADMTQRAIINTTCIAGLMANAPNVWGQM